MFVNDEEMCWLVLGVDESCFCVGEGCDGGKVVLFDCGEDVIEIIECCIDGCDVGEIVGENFC